jgi:hypothetical protein
MECTAEFTQRSLHPPAQRREDFVSGQNSASRLDRVLGPRSPILRRSIAGIPSHGRPGTGVRRIGRRALISIAWSTGISGLPRVAWRRRGWGSGVGVSRVAWRSVTRGGVGGLLAWVSIARRSGVSGVSRVALIAIAGLGVAWISVRRRSVRRVAVGWVAVVSARWRRRCARNSSEYPGCPSNRCSEGGSRPATRRCSNGSTRSGSQYAPTKAALDGIIRVRAGREAQRRQRDHKGRNSGHYLVLALGR